MSLTILTADELQNLEMRAANQLGADTLMKRAGAAAAELIMKRLEDAGVEQRRVTLPVVRDDLLDLFLDFVRDEEHAILISSHITSDLEKIADYVTFLHAGKLLLTKPKDELLWKYGVLRCGEEQFQKLDGSEVLAWQKKDYSYDVLVPDREELLRRYPEAVVDRATMDEILLLYVKGAQKK